MDVTASCFNPPLAATPPQVLIEYTWGLYRALECPCPMIGYNARWLLEHVPKNSRKTLVHGDFRNGNLMTASHGIMAVLD